MFAKNDHFVTLSAAEINEEGMRIIKETLNKFGSENLGVLFDASKESLVVLQLLKTYFGGKVAFPAIFVDIRLAFKEIYEYVQQIKDQWSLNLITVRDETTEQYSHGDLTQRQCCHAHIAVPLRRILSDIGLKTLLIGSQANEESQRDSNYVEILTEGQFTVVNVTSDFTDVEIWSYIRYHNLPYCKIYDMGYRILRCQCCVKPASFHSRQVKTSDQEQVETIEKLRSLGYI